MVKFCILFLLFFTARGKDVYPVRLVQHFLFQSNVACGNILETNNLSDTEKVLLFSYFKILTKEFSLFTVMKFENRLKNTRRCPTTLNLVFGWQQGVREKLKEVSYKEKISGSFWLIFLPFNITSHEYLKDVNIPYNSEFFITARMEEKEIILERAYKVNSDYPLRVSIYGIWNRVFDAMVEGSGNDYVYNGRKNLEGFPIRASTKDDYPISRLIKTGNEFKIEGYFGLIFYELAERLKFKPVYVEAKQNSTGSPNANGTYNGLLGMIERNEIDLSVAPQVFTKKVTSVAAFLKPLLRSNFQIFFKHDGNRINWLVIFKPFDIYVWLFIILWFLLSSFVVDLLYDYETKLNHENKIRKDEFIKYNAFFNNFGALCQQGVPTPESYSCRNMFLQTFILSTVLVTAYSAVLISNIANREPTRPFNSLETFPKDGSYKLVAIGDSTDFSYFSESIDKLRKGIYEKAMKNNPESRKIVKKEDGMDIICRRKNYAFFVVFAVPKLTAQEYSNNEKLNCKILYLKTPLDIVFLTIPRRKDLPYAELFDWELLKMETSGILKKLRNEVWPLEQKAETNYSPVIIEHVMLIHGILIFGMILAIFILATELHFYIRRRRNKKYP